MTGMGLVAIAEEMRRRLDDVEKGHVTRQLFGGLMLVLERRGRTYRLAIGRTKTAPGRQEAALVARDFGLPSAIEWNWTSRRNTKHKLTYQVAECQWIEDTQPVRQEGSHA